MNDLKLDGLIRSAEKLFPAYPVHLVTPVRDYPDHPAGAFGPAELLPAVTCIGSCTSQPIDMECDPVLYRSLSARSARARAPWTGGVSSSTARMSGSRSPSARWKAANSRGWVVITPPPATTTSV